MSEVVSGKMRMSFAGRTDWDFGENGLAVAAREIKVRGGSLVDLTVSNPTKCGFDYACLEMTEAMGSSRNLEYAPDPWGLLRAREAVSRFYADNGCADVPVDRLMLTASTSEGYGYILKLLCNAGDEILAPVPSYPLFQFLADVSDVKIVRYPLVYGCSGWAIDRSALVSAITGRTRAILVVSPNNPTGSFLRSGDAEFLRDLAAERGLAVVCDEVFGDYVLDVGADAVRTLAGGSGGPLTFVLSGLSKILALPQMKLAWIVVQGGAGVCCEACRRLEMIADTFLSVGTPVQNACVDLLARRGLIQAQVRRRLGGNLAFLRGVVSQVPRIELYRPEGGWFAVLRLHGVRDEEAFAVSLLREGAVMVHPGYFYDFEEGAHVVLSLLTPEDVLRVGMGAVVERMRI
jgi:alanine-synthesizing transaminase